MIGLHFSPSSYLYRKHPARQPAGKPWGKIEKSFTPSPLVHELLKHQSKYHYRVLTAFKISGYSSSSDKKKAVEVLINIKGSDLRLAFVSLVSHARGGHTLQTDCWQAFQEIKNKGLCRRHG